MVSWALGWLLLVLSRTDSNKADQSYAGIILHEAPEFYEADGVTLKPSSGKQPLRFFTPRPESGAIGDGMGSLVPFFRELLRDLNHRQDLLPDYILELHLEDSRCLTHTAVQTAITAMYRHPPGFFHLIFGPLCSDATGAMNDAIQPFNAFQIAPQSRSPGLADRTRYPFLCRLSPSLQFGSIGVARMCKLFGWSRIGAVYDSTDLTRDTVDRFATQLQAELEAGYAFDLPFLASATHTIQDLSLAGRVVGDLQKVGAKVVVAALYEAYGIVFFCELYRQQYYGASVQVIVAVGWWSDTWISEQMSSSIQCTAQEMHEATKSVLSLGQTAFSHVAYSPTATMRHDITGHDLNSVRSLYFRACLASGEGCRDDFASYDYDALALAIHTFRVWIYEQGHSLSEIDYSNDSPREELFRIASQSAFVGVSGQVSFFDEPGSECERRGTFSLKQFLPNITALSDWGWAEVVSYRHDEGFATFVHWSTLKWASGNTTYFGAGSGFGDLVAAPGVRQSFGDAVGLENIPSDRLACPIGHRPNYLRTACEECPTGTSAGTVGSWDCDPCDRGTFAASTGSASCNFCPPGEHQPNIGASSCEGCPRGTVSDPQALWQCVKCEPGKFTSDEGQSECARCDIGTFSDHAGMTLCKECEGYGMTTTYMAATSSNDCLCTSGKYRDAVTRDCIDCPQGMICADGSDMLNFLAGVFTNLTERTAAQQFPVLETGHMSFGAQPLIVYQCADEAHCPGKIPGRACASGRTGVACGRCLDDYGEASGGQCVACDTGAVALVSGILFLVALLVIAISTLKLNNRQSRSSSAMMLLTIVGILVSNLQTMTIFRRSALHWEFPLSTVLEASGIVTFEVESFKASCVIGADPVRQYLFKQCLVPLCMPIILFTVLAKKRWGPKDREEVPVQLADKVGTICSMLFISILVSAVSSLYCYAHPAGGHYSMVSSPSVLCYEGGGHTTMVIISVVAVLLVPLPYTTVVMQTTFQYPSLVIKNSARVRAMRFLFLRFHRHRYFYGVALLVRNICVCMVPVMFRDATVLQVAFLCAIISGSVLLQQRLDPWLSPVSNVVDGIMAHLMLLVLISGVMATPGLEGSAGGLGMVAFLGLSTLAATTLVFAMRNLFRDGWSYYHLCVCHHKAAAAAQGRYLKVLLEHATGHPVILDSDDLQDLDQQLSTIRTEVDHLIVYLTRDTLSRAWCASEIATAMANRVEVTGAITPSFARPTMEELDDPNFFEGFKQGHLKQCNLSPQMLASSSRQFLAKANFVELRDSDRGRMRLTNVAMRLLAKPVVQSKKDAQPEPGATPIVISADAGDDEAVAAAGILASEVSTAVATRPGLEVCFLPDDEQDLDSLAGVVASSVTLLVLLSRGSLQSLPQLVAMVEFMLRAERCPSFLHASRTGSASRTSQRSNRSSPSLRGSAMPSRLLSAQSSRTSAPSVLGPCVLPVWIPSFVFPEQQYYEQELPRLWPGKVSKARRCLEAFFERPTICLPVDAPDKVMACHTVEILSRIAYGKSPNSEEVNKEGSPSMAAKSWSEVPSDDSSHEQPPETSADRVAVRMESDSGRRPPEPPATDHRLAQARPHESRKAMWV